MKLVENHLLLLSAIGTETGTYIAKSFNTKGQRFKGSKGSHGLSLFDPLILCVENQFRGGPLTENRISRYITDAAIEVHRTLGGPGLLESVYEEALAWELLNAGLCVERQLEVPIIYKERLLANPLRLDILVEKKVIVEAKATISYNTIFEVQARTYLRLCDLKLAIVINFGEKYVKDGIHRVVNGMLED
jgi:GxxExxY protein